MTGANHSVTCHEGIDRPPDHPVDLFRFEPRGDVEDHPRPEIGLAQFGKLIGRQVEILDPQIAARRRRLQVIPHRAMHHGGAGVVKLPAQIGEPVGLGHADAKDRLAELGQDETEELPAAFLQHLARRCLGIDHRQRVIGLTAAFAGCNLGKQQPLVGKIAVERGLRHPGRPGDIVHRGAFEPMREKDVAGPGQHLIEFTAPAHLRHLCAVHQPGI